MRFFRTLFMLILGMTIAFWSCKQKTENPCLKSVPANPEKFAGFAKLPGGFVAVNARYVSEDGPSFKDDEISERITGSFEFLRTGSGDNVLDYVDIVSSAGTLFLDNLNYPYIEVFYDGSYLRLPILGEATESVDRIFAEAVKRGFDRDLTSYALSTFRQGPNSRSPEVGSEKSIRDYLRNDTKVKMCPQGDCIGLGGMRVYRFKIDLSDERLQKLYADEIFSESNPQGVKPEELRAALREVVGKISEERLNYIKGLASEKPDLYKAYASYRAFQMAMLQSEKLEGYLHYQACLEEAELDETRCEKVRKHAKFQEFKTFSKEVVEPEQVIKNSDCQTVQYRDFLVSAYKSEAYSICLDSFSKDQWAIGLNGIEQVPADQDYKLPLEKAEAVSVDAGKEGLYESGLKLFLNHAMSVGKFGFQSYQSVLEAAKALQIEYQIFTNYVPPQKDSLAAGAPMEGVFYGGFPMPTKLEQATEQLIRLNGQDVKIEPFKALQSVIIHSTEEPWAVKITWDQSMDRVNFRYCSQKGSSLMLAGLPVLATYGGCLQAGGSAIIPAPYTNTKDLVSAQGPEEVDAPDRPAGAPVGRNNDLQAGGPSSPNQQQQGPMYSELKPTSGQQIAGCE